MKMIEVSCANCGKKIYVFDEYARNKMFCTLSCLDLDPHAPPLLRSTDLKSLVVLPKQ